MFDKILIANRGEIACRIIASARKLGIKSVAIYSDADKYAKHVKLADEAIHVGASHASESYLNIDRIIDAARLSGAEAIHPGYGFLSENVEFCLACEKNEIVFIGPPPQAIENMGSKSLAKSMMEKASVPLVPGYHGENQSVDFLRAEAEKIAYPVLIKAAAGGGGKGMRIVREADAFEAELMSAKREARSSFANDDMLLEKYLERPRHIEIQVFFDKFGEGVYLFERDCSIQRRHQKIIEEAPGINISEALRAKMGQAALDAARAINYVGAGTVEFLVESPKDENSEPAFYFMEMNTRLQVEHPVTEMITRLDLVEWQLRIAAGEALPKKQNDLQIHGHAIELRLYAENPANNFFPETGRVDVLNEPDENSYIRVDSGLQAGDEVSVYYDPMLAKLISWGHNRSAAIKHLQQGLSQYLIAGVINNIDYLNACISSEPFLKGELNTHFIDDHAEDLLSQCEAQNKELAPEILAVLALSEILTINQSSDINTDAWSKIKNWRLNGASQPLMSVHCADEKFTVNYRASDCSSNSWEIISSLNNDPLSIEGELEGNLLHYSLNGCRKQAKVFSHKSQIYLLVDGHRYIFERDSLESNLAKNASSVIALASNLSAPMNGRIIDVCVGVGDRVSEGQALVVMEAMKMEYTLKAPGEGVVESLLCKSDQLVKGGELLVELDLDGVLDNGK